MSITPVEPFPTEPFPTRDDGSNRDIALANSIAVSVTREEGSMKAAVLRAIQKPLEIEDVQLASPGPHEVVVRTAAVGVCHSDVHFWQGLWVWPMPVVLGHESAGVVEEVGSAVKYVQPGDHVITCQGERSALFLER